MILKMLWRASWIYEFFLLYEIKNYVHLVSKIIILKKNGGLFETGLALPGFAQTFKDILINYSTDMQTFLGERGSIL